LLAINFSRFGVAPPLLKGQQVQRRRLTISEDGETGMGLGSMMRLMIEAEYD